MILKDSQKKVVVSVSTFFQNWKNEFLQYSEKISKLSEAGMEDMIKDIVHPVKKIYESIDEYKNFSDIPENHNGPYPRLCIKVPTGGGKTLLGVETIRIFHDNFLEKKTGMVLWVVHSESIYGQTIEKLKDKHSPYRQKLDQVSGGRTLILEKNDAIRYQDTQENLCVLMLMIQSANRETKENLKIFKDSGTFMDFFPYEYEQEKTDILLEQFPSLETIDDKFFGRRHIVTSLGNVLRVCNPLFVIDEFHKVYTDAQKRILDDLNPKCIIGLSATPRDSMNVLIEITGMELYHDQMIKLPINVRPEVNDNWRELVGDVKKKREEVEKISIKHKESKGDYIRPIALLQAERTGVDKRDGVHVHAEDVKDYLIQLGVSPSQIAIKSAYVDELKGAALLSQDCDIRYIITKQALMEGWDCPFAYVLGVIPQSSSTTALTQLVGRVLRQPYTKRTGVPELDECYTFFNHADSDELLRGIKKSLEADGLGDIVDTVKGPSGPSGKSLLYKDFPIQKNIKKEYPESLYLPVWHIKEKKGMRLLSYHSDIVSRISWDDVDITQVVGLLSKTIKVHIVKGIDYKYFLGETYLSEANDYEKEHIEGGDEYIISQILSEYILNPFVAYAFVEKILNSLEKSGISRQEIESDFGYIAHELVLFTKEECHRQEEMIFTDLVGKGIVILAISKEGGYQIPEKYYAPAKEDEDDKSVLIPYKQDIKSLHLAVDFVTMNNLEKEIIEELRQQDKVLWWMRNKVQPDAYKIQAWRKNKIYPDFVVAKKSDNGELELVYIVESKGDQLADNLDTKYKSLVFHKMTSSEVVNNIREFKDYEFSMVSQSKTKQTLRELLK